MNNVKFIHVISNICVFKKLFLFFFQDQFVQYLLIVSIKSSDRWRCAFLKTFAKSAKGCGGAEWIVNPWLAKMPL